VSVSYLLLILVVGAIAEGVGFITNHYQRRERGGKRIMMQRGYIVLIVGGTLFVIGRIIAAAGASQFAGMLYMKTYLSTNS
jgi:hypothetical protein